MLCLFFFNLPTVRILRSLGGLLDAFLSSDLNRANHYSLLILSSAKFPHPYVSFSLSPWPYSAFLIHHLDEVGCKIKSLIRLPVSNLDHSELSLSCRHTVRLSGKSKKLPLHILWWFHTGCEIKYPHNVSCLLSFWHISWPSLHALHAPASWLAYTSHDSAGCALP